MKTPNRFSVALSAAAALAVGCSSSAKPDPVTPAGNSTHGDGEHEARADLHGPFVKHIETFPGQGPQRTIEGSQASLVTTANGAFVAFETGELTPGHVYTLWWVVMNAPSKCSASPCTAEDILQRHAEVKAEITWADGLVAPESGKAMFSGYLKKGEVWKSWFGNHFTNPLGAEIHLVLNDHGPAVADQVEAMITTYRTGCTDESLPPPFPDTAKADGEAGPNKCALVQDVIFQQSEQSE